VSKSGFDYLDAYKRTEQSSALEWFNEKMLVWYGNVVQVIDMNTVVVVPAVNAEGFDEPATVTLLHPSSVLFEFAVEPQVGDRALVWALNKKTPGMFDSAEPIVDPNARRYGVFSGVGLLLSTRKGASATTVMHDREGPNDMASLESDAVLSLLLGRALSLVFGASGNADELVRIVFGALSPLSATHRAAVSREHGFDRDADGKEIAVPAPVSERYSVGAPIARDIQGAQTLSAGFGVDADGNEQATEAPIEERYSVGAPITRSVQGAQTIAVGLDAEGGSTEAPIDVKLGEKAGVSLTSASGVKLHFDKAVVAELGEGFEWKIAGDLTVTVDGKVNISSAGCVINNVLEVK
jgi:hypothetical protein